MCIVKKIYVSRTMLVSFTQELKPGLQSRSLEPRKDGELYL